MAKRKPLLPWYRTPAFVVNGKPIGKGWVTKINDGGAFAAIEQQQRGVYLVEIEGVVLGRFKTFTAAQEAAERKILGTG